MTDNDVREPEKLPIDRYFNDFNVSYHQFINLIKELIFMLSDKQNPKSIGPQSEKIIKQLDLFIVSSRALRKQFMKMGFTQLKKNKRAIYLSHFITITNIILNNLYRLKSINGSINTQFSQQAAAGEKILNEYVTIFENLKKMTDRWVEKFILSQLIIA